MDKAPLIKTATGLVRAVFIAFVLIYPLLSYAEVYEYKDKDGTTMIGVRPRVEAPLPQEKKQPSKKPAIKDKQPMLSQKPVTVDSQPAPIPAATRSSGLFTAFILLSGIAAVIVIIYKLHSRQTKQIATMPALSIEINDKEDYLREKFKRRDKDDWVGMFWEVDKPRPVNAVLNLNYQSGKGERTERIVDVQNFGYYGDFVYLNGICRLRGESRSFRTDRILQCIDIESGEVIDNVHDFIQEKYKQTPEYSIDSLTENEYDAFRVLFYVSKADGFLMKPEKAIISNTCRALVNDSRITGAMIDKLFKSIDVPTVNAFKMAINRLSRRDMEVRTLIIKAAKDMISTQKTIHPLEKDAISFMEKRLMTGLK